MMLEERMVSAFKEAQAVRIVDPTAWCCDVELWVPSVIAELDRFWHEIFLLCLVDRAGRAIAVEMLLVCGF